MMSDTAMSDTVQELLQAVAERRVGWEQAAPLLRDLLAPSAPAEHDAPEVPRTPPDPAQADAERVYPLSRGQAALWAIHQAAPRTASYNLPLGLVMRPDADLRLMEQALDALLERNPELRINVRARRGGPVQVVAERTAAPQLLDFGHLTEHEATERVRALVREPFDLEHDPLYRIHFLRGPWPGPLLLLVFHHLITDGVSTHLMLQELVADYESLARTGQPATHGARTPYRDFVHWQRRMLAGPEGAGHSAYWSRRLAGASTGALLDRLADRHPDGPSRFVGGSVQLELDPPTWDAVRATARSQGLPPFSVLHAAFVGLLHRYTGIEDVSVLVPTDGRPAQEFDRTLGYLINPVVLRTTCTARTTALGLFRAVYDELLDAEDHSAYPFACVVDDIRRGGDPSAGFDIGFYLQQGVGKDLDMAQGQTLFGDALPMTQEGESGLVVEVVVRGDRALVHVKFDSDLFERPTVERLAEHYRVLLQEMVRHPDREVGEVELYTPHERELVRRANDTAVPPPRRPTALGMVLDQAQRTPHATAVVDADKSLTYRELAGRIALLADVLRRRGVAPGELVGVMVGRRAELIAALLAVHCVGAAYVPLDPQFPADRLEFIIADAGIGTVLCDAQSARSLPAGAGAPVLLDEIDWPAAADRAASPASDSAESDGADDTAYVLYTSGSTGRPKGVQISQRALANFLTAMARRPGCCERDVVLAVTTVSFDISGLELLLPLTCGGAVEIVPAETAKDGAALRERIESGPATLVQATPATWRLLLAAGWTGPFDGRILCGGEPLPTDLAEKLLNRADEVWNMYGPTETTIWSSAARVRRHGPVIVGTPIDNTRFHVLDDAGHPVPFGVPGELCIAGHGVARGYLGRPELTREKFPDGAFLGESGPVFRTGDRARHAADGGLELLGRLDRQVKLHGYRIELGEIEAAARRSELVEEARVLLREDTPGHQALVAFAAAPAGGAADGGIPDRLRAHLADWLPSYMVPARIVVLRSLPRTPNAKTDVGPLQQLPIDEIVRRFGFPDQVTGDDGAGRAAPPDPRPVPDDDRSGALLRALRALVAEIAGLAEQSIAPDRPVGDYGFDSIRFTELSALLRDRLDLSVPPTAFYGHPTIAALAAHLAAAHPGAGGSGPGASAQPAGPGTAARHRAPGAPVGRTAAEQYRPIAIIGIGARLPGADSLDGFWAHLEAGADLIRPYPVERGFSRSLFGRFGAPDGFAGSYIDGVEDFDAPLFRVSAREAAQMDPQHRLLLHAAREAMEDSGTAPAAFAGGRTGVFVGISGGDYFSLLGHERESGDHFLLGNVASVAANRISYVFDLHGQSAVYDTACSSSLVAVHRAVRALQLDECDTALAGGANLLLSPYGFLGLRRAGMLSPDGRCKTFDARADGYGRGEGVVLLLLKPLDRARRDGDPVHGVIIGSAENHGGRTHSLTAPNPQAQSDVVLRAHRSAGVPPESIRYIEAHGTGTPLGDPIEVDGLNSAFSRLLTDGGADPGAARIALGSVKTNIGHLEAAAGVAGVVKILLAMKHRTLPGLVHLAEPNPLLALAAGPFHLQVRTTPWPAWRDREGRPAPRRAGVSSFGMGGSNAHVVLEETEEF
jgi:polyketide synthase PksJ